MNWKATWTATLVGTAVGTGGWMAGLGHILWPEHPGWALFLATLAATIVTRMIAAQRPGHAGAAQG